MTRITLLLAAAALGAGPAAAQTRYLPQADTLYYESVNPYRMYFVVRGDTVGPGVREHTVERHVWRAEEGGLLAEIRGGPLDGAEARTQVLEVSPRGVVGADRHPGADHRVRRDFVLRLPTGKDLRPGLVWHDTLSDTARVEGNEYAFQVARELRVERITDTLGSRMAVVRGAGTLRYRDFYPSGQPGRYSWIDVSGPVRDTYLFDVRHGRTAAREWWMDLRGTAAFPRPGGRMDTVPAGLLSADTTRLISPARARSLATGRQAKADGRHSPGAVGTVRRGARSTCSPGCVSPSPQRRMARPGACPRYPLRGANLGTRVAQIARSSCEGANGALLYRREAVLTQKP